MPTSKPILCGSIAGSIGGLGIKMHNAAFAALGLPYTSVSFEPSSAQGALDAMRALGIRGLGVTMPYKEEVAPLLDRLDDVSRETGAVNTILNEDGVLTGYNVDGHGAVAALLERTGLAGKKVAILGAGGGAKTIAYTLRQYTGDITIFNRGEARGRAAAKLLGLAYGGGLHDAARADYDILINATSVGFKSDDTPLARDQLRAGSVVFDIVFAPAVTRLQREAAAAGCTVIPGTRMIMHQAMKQFTLYTSVDAPADVYEAVMKAALQ